MSEPVGPARAGGPREIRVLWSGRDWASAIAGLPAEGPLPCRTVLVPRGRVAHALRRRLLREGLAVALAGTRFVATAVAAIEVLRAADVAFMPGEESVRRARLLGLFRTGVALQHFPRELLETRPGWDDAFARTIHDLEASGRRPDELDRAVGAEGDPDTAARLRDLAIVWRAADAGAATSWTLPRIYREAARVLEVDPGHWPFPGATLMTASPSTPAAEAAFLRAIPGATLGLLAARPVRPRVIDHLGALFGPEAARAVEMASPPREHGRERDLLAAYLFEPPEVLAGPGRARSAGPDGSVDLEEHPGVEAEIEAAADWVARQVLDGTPLGEIAVLLPALDPLASLVADRVARLPWPDGDTGIAAAPPRSGLPVHVAGGLPLVGTTAGARALAVVRALRAHLAGDALAAVVPALRVRERVADPAGAAAVPEGQRTTGDSRHLSHGAAMRLVWSMGTAGGNAAHTGGALDWGDRMARKVESLGRELAEVTAGGAATDAADPGAVRRIERGLADLTAVRPALDALVGVARRVLAGATLASLWPAVREFLETWLLQPGDGPRVQAMLDERLARLAADTGCGALAGDDALALIEDALADQRVATGRFGEPAVYIGTVHDAVGLEFRAVRVIGLAEGHLPAPPREDPVLPDALRAALAVATTADRALAALHALDRVVRDTETRLALSAPRIDLDRSQREPSSILLEAAAALSRPASAGVDAGPGRGEAHAPLIPGLPALRRDAFAPARRAALAARRATPIGAAAWADAVAARALAIPPSWRGAPALDLERVHGLLDAHEASGLDGLLGPLAADLLVPGLTADRPVSPSILPTLLQCPHLFLLGTVLRMEEPEGAPALREIGQPHYGGLLHRVAERFSRTHGAAFGARAETLETWLARADRIVEEEFTRFLDQYPLVGGTVTGRERERLRRDVRELLEHDWSAPSRRFVDVERTFGPLELSLGAYSLFVRGRVDRIDVEPGLTVVRDLKTGRPHRRTRDETQPVPSLDVQLAVYGMVAQAMARTWQTPERVGVAYTYVNRGVEERPFREDFQTVLVPAAREWLALAAELLARRWFPRTPDPADCRHCCFQPVCGEHVHERAGRLLAADPVLARFQAFKAGEDEED